MRRHGSGRVMGHPFVRTGCAAFLLLPCGLGIWGGWAAFAAGDAIPATAEHPHERNAVFLRPLGAS